MKETLRDIYLCRTANVSWRTCVVVKQIQSNQHQRTEPSAFRTRTTGLAHGDLEGTSTRASICWCRYSLSSLSKPHGVIRRGCRTGRAVPVSILCFTRVQWPKSFLSLAKASWCITRNCFSRCRISGDSIRVQQSWYRAMRYSGTSEASPGARASADPPAQSVLTPHLPEHIPWTG